jgi:hypothetical protein
LLKQVEAMVGGSKAELADRLAEKIREGRTGGVGDALARGDTPVANPGVASGVNAPVTPPAAPARPGSGFKAIGLPVPRAKRLNLKFAKYPEALADFKKHAPQVGDIYLDGPMGNRRPMRVTRVDSRPLLVTGDMIDDGVGHDKPGWHIQWDAEPVESDWFSGGGKDSDPDRPPNILSSPPGVNGAGRSAALPKYHQNGHKSHRDYVESLYKQGKGVSPESAAKYPDLAAKYGKGNQ